MTINNNSLLKIYCENIVDIIFIILTQYKFKIFFFLFPPFICHFTATHHIWIRTSTLPSFFLFFFFPQGFHFPRFILHHTFKNNLCTMSAFNFYIFFPSFVFLAFISSITPTSQFISFLFFTFL